MPRSSPAAPQVDRRAWLALALAASAYTVIAVNLTGTNIAFPAIEESFSGTSRGALSWALTGYSIVLATFLLVGGRLADRLGRRRVFVGGVVGFCVASVLTAVAPAAQLFVAGRVLQGVAGAFIVPSSLALVLPLFPVERRTSVVAMWAASGSTGAALAPSLSAFIVDGIGWRYVYLLALPVGVAVLVFGGRLLPESRATPTGIRLDLLGVALGTLGIGCVTFAIIESRNGVPPISIAAIAAALVLIPWFLRRSLRHPSPLFDPRLFKVRTVWSANLANLFMSMTGLSIWLIWPLFLTQIWDYSLLKAGLAITPGPVVSAFAGVAAGRFADRHGSRELIALGSIVPSIAITYLLVFLGSEVDYVRSMLPASILFGFGFGITFSPLNGAALAGVSPDDYGLANAIFNTVRNLGGGLGVAIVVALLGDAVPIPLEAFERTFAIMAVVALIPAAVVWFTYPRRPVVAAPVDA